jgi:hypothetical protein
MKKGNTVQQPPRWGSRCERIVPIHVPVQPGRSEAQSTKSPRVPINAFGAKRELYPIAKEVTVMIEVMNIYFEASLLNFLQERF